MYFMSWEETYSPFFNINVMQKFTTMPKQPCTKQPLSSPPSPMLGTYYSGLHWDAPVTELNASIHVQLTVLIVNFRTSYQLGVWCVNHCGCLVIVPTLEWISDAYLSNCFACESAKRGKFGHFFIMEVNGNFF